MHGRTLPRLYSGRPQVNRVTFLEAVDSPYRRVTVGDVVLLKTGLIVASFRTASVGFIELNEREFNRLVTDYSAAICADEEFWKARTDRRYATLSASATFASSRLLR